MGWYSFLHANSVSNVLYPNDTKGIHLILRIDQAIGILISSVQPSPGDV
jgi:hypothetical protein